jgi:hypothetical protein
LLLAGCSSSSSSAAGPDGSAPSGAGDLTAIDQALCDRILTKAEVGAIAQTTVTNVKVITTGSGGSCNYETAPNKAAMVVVFFFGSSDAGPGVILQAMADSITKNPGFTGSVTPVSGFGDAAQAIVNPIPNTAVIQYDLFIAQRNYVVGFQYPNSQAGEAVAIGQLKQAAQLALPRI